MIEFQYFEGCPHYRETLRNLEELVSEGFVSKKDIKITEVPDPESAERLHFQGSPTILVDGYDIYTEAKPESFYYACRVYLIDGKMTGTFSKEFIKGRISMMK